MKIFAILIAAIVLASALVLAKPPPGGDPCYIVVQCFAAPCYPMCADGCDRIEQPCGEPTCPYLCVRKAEPDPLPADAA